MTSHFDLASQVQDAGKTFWGDLTTHRYEVSPGRLAHLKHLHNAQYENAIERYRSAMINKDWLTTGEIECLIGVGKTVANAFLRKMVKNGVLERRPRDGKEKYTTNRGWEYKWKQQ